MAGASAWLAENAHWAWWIGALALVLLEVMAPGAVFLWMGVSAGVVGVLAAVVPDLDPRYQFVAFALLSVSSILVARRYLKSRPLATDQPTLNRRGAHYIGRTFTLATPIEHGVGRLHVDDTMWKISGPDMAAGAKVKVTGVDGVVLRVEAVE